MIGNCGTITFNNKENADKFISDMNGKTTYPLMLSFDRKSLDIIRDPKANLLVTNIPLKLENDEFKELFI